MLIRREYTSGATSRLIFEYGRVRGREQNPEVTPEVTPEVVAMLSDAMSRREIMQQLDLKDEKRFREHYQQVAILAGLIQMTLPDKPHSKNQKYRITEKGKEFLRK